MTDLEVLAKTLRGEAENQGREGQEAVANVIMNRVTIAGIYRQRHLMNHPLYGDGTVSGACLAPRQFSCWQDPHALKRMDAVDAQSPEWLVATAAISGELSDSTGGATHYHTIQAPSYAKTWPPRWAIGQTPTATIGDHVFYRL